MRYTSRTFLLLPVDTYTFSAIATFFFNPLTLSLSLSSICVLFFLCHNCMNFNRSPVQFSFLFFNQISRQKNGRQSFFFKKKKAPFFLKKKKGKFVVIFTAKRWIWLFEGNTRMALKNRKLNTFRFKLKATKFAERY